MNPYTIAPGDTLSAIAAKNGLGVNDILGLNPHITDPNKIYAGTNINLPGSKTAPVATAPGATPVAPQAPTPVDNTVSGSSPTLGTPTPDRSAPNYSDIASKAGAAGLGVADLSKLFGPTSDEQTAAKDKIAQQFGYANSADFYNAVFAKPTQTTEQFYNDAYTKAGLPNLLSSISSKKDALNRALGTVNDNPWYDEAFRRGEASRLQTLADGDIKNLQDDYNLRLGSVHDLVTRHADDLKTSEAMNTARLNYLQSTAEANATAAASARTGEYLSDYAKGKIAAEKPQTLNVPGSDTAYQWNPTTKQWTPINTGTTTTDPSVVDYSSFTSGLSQPQQKFFANMKEQDKSNVTALLNGDALLSDIAKGGVQGTKEAQRLLGLARQLDPTFSENVNKSRYQFLKDWNDPQKSSFQNRVTINTALGHIADLKTLVSQLPNNYPLKQFNSWADFLSEQTNKSIIPQFNQVLTALASEYAGLYKGGSPTDPEIQSWKDTILKDYSPSTIDSLINQGTKLAADRLNSTTNEYKNSMGKYPTDSLVQSDSLAKLQAAGVDTASLESVMAKSGYKAPGLGDKIDAALQHYSPGDVINYLLQDPSTKDQVLRMQQQRMTPEDILDTLKKADSAGTSSQASADGQGGNADDVMTRISRNESGGDYQALGPTTASGDRAYGKYQIMGNNIPQWSKLALGRSVSTAEFLQNPAIQDAIIKDQYQRARSKGLSDSQFAAQWFSGSPNVNSQKRDILGVSTSTYVKKFNNQT